MASIRGKRKRRASINSRSKLVPWYRLACRLIVLREKAAGGKRRGPPSIGSWEITIGRSLATITRPADVETVCIRIEPMKTSVRNGHYPFSWHYWEGASWRWRGLRRWMRASLYYGRQYRLSG